MRDGHFNRRTTLNAKTTLDNNMSNVIWGTAIKKATKQIMNINKSLNVYLILIFPEPYAKPVNKQKIEMTPPSMNHSQHIFIDCRKNNRMKKK